MSDLLPTSEVAAALVAHAVRQSMGDEPLWDEVKAALCQLRDDPLGPVHLGKAAGDLNDRAAVVVISSWLNRMLETDGMGANKAGRRSTVLVHPLQTGAFGLVAATTLAMVIGTLGASVGLATLAVSIVASGLTTFGRWRLSETEDARKLDSDRTRRLLASLANATK